MMNLFYLFSGLSSLFTVVWSIPFLLLNYINIKLYTSTSKQKYNIIKKLIKYNLVVIMKHSWHTVTGLLLMMRILERYLLLIIKQKKLNQCF